MGVFLSGIHIPHMQRRFVSIVRLQRVGELRSLGRRVHLSQREVGLRAYRIGIDEPMLVAVAGLPINRGFFLMDLPVRVEQPGSFFVREGNSIDVVKLFQSLSESLPPGNLVEVGFGQRIFRADPGLDVRGVFCFEPAVRI